MSNDRKRPVFAWFVAMVCVTGTVLGTLARAEDLSRYCGHPVDSRHIRTIGKPLPASTCTANCFSFVLRCNNGRQYNLTSRYNPHDPDWLNWFTDVYPVPQLIVFVTIAFLAFVMARGRARKPELNFTYLGIVGFTMYFWPELSTTDTYGFTASLTQIGAVISVVGLPIFLLLNLPALMRGWNYVFVQHPIEPIVSPALKAGTVINTKAVARTLEAGAYDKGAYPAYHYENQAEKARALAAQLEADAMRKVEQARAEVAEAERRYEEAMRRKR